VLQRFTPSGAVISAAFNGSLTAIAPAQFTSIALQSDGKQVVGGAIRAPNNKHATIPTVSRLSVSGATEFTTPGFNFGTGVNNVTATLEALLVESSGRIIAGGIAALSSGEQGFGLAAVRADGTIDPAFGSAQGLSTRISGNDTVNAILQQSDGKIIAVGTCNKGIGLARYFGP
jgi:Domain of unknown function (DUF5122) beta-propeller